MKQRFFEANGIKFMQMVETGQNYIWDEAEKLWVLVLDNGFSPPVQENITGGYLIPLRTPKRIIKAITKILKKNQVLQFY